MTAPRRVVVVGGGISGLATAYRIRSLSRDAPPEIVVLEGSDRPGGKIRTDRDGGLLREWGPNGFLDNVPETLDLVRELGLEGRLVAAREEAANRFLFHGKGLWKVPSSKAEFFHTGLLPLSAKLRILLEPWARRAPEGDESVFDFARRRIGEVPARRLVDAMVRGVFAGDSRALSLRSAFPAMAAMEKEHGSLMRAMKERARERARLGGEAGSGGGPFGPGGTLRSFDGGMQVLTDALAQSLGGAVRTGKRAMGIAREGDGWAVQSSDGEIHRADAVVVAAPAPDAAMLLHRLDPRFREPLEAIPLAPVTVVALRYRAEDASKAAKGFGFLVPGGEPLSVLGVLWESTVFPGRAPEGEVLLRAMIGGARNPDLAALPEDEIVHVVRRDLFVAMSIEADPLEVRLHRHLQGIPQYNLGHADRLVTLNTIRCDHPGLHLTGNSYRGVALNLCVRDAGAVAAAVLG